MCCPLDCKRDLKPGDWTPCIDCMDAEEKQRYREETHDYREWGFALDKGVVLRETRPNPDWPWWRRYFWYVENA